MKRRSVCSPSLRGGTSQVPDPVGDGDGSCVGPGGTRVSRFVSPDLGTARKKGYPTTARLYPRRRDVPGPGRKVSGEHRWGRVRLGPGWAPWVSLGPDLKPPDPHNVSQDNSSLPLVLNHSSDEAPVPISPHVGGEDGTHVPSTEGEGRRPRFP